MIKLYSYFRSSSSFRVRIALNLKNLEYETIPVHLVKDGGEQHKDEFSLLNPSRRLPVLVHAGKPIAQSVAIIEYIDGIFLETQLYPTTPFERAKARQLVEIINSDIQPLQNLSVLKSLKEDWNFSEEDKVKWIQHWINLGFQSFESVVKETAGKYSIGDLPGVVDCFLIPQVFNAVRFNVDLSPFPTITSINETALKHPAFIKAHPDNQPDRPE